MLELLADLLIRFLKASLDRRERQIHDFCNLFERHLLDVPQDEDRPVFDAEAIERPVEPPQELRRRRINSGDASVWQLACVRQHHPTPDSPALQLRLERPNGDGEYEAAKRGRLFQRAYAREQAKKYLLQDIVRVVTGTERSVRYLVHEGRISVPHRRLRPRLFRTEPLDELR